jgi:hypothetical protein
LINPKRQFVGIVANSRKSKGFERHPPTSAICLAKPTSLCYSSGLGSF